jgi:osmotically-inducible protein OsmY
MQSIHRRTKRKANFTFTLLFGLLLSTGVMAKSALDLEIGDANIKRAVENEILYDGAIPYNDIDVGTSSGVVTLQGYVDNILAKERARRIAETVKGVRAVVNQIKVVPDPRPSAGQLRADVVGALIDDPATDSFEIQVEARDDGTVTLSGTADSWQEMKLGETVAKGVKGVTAIENNIQVDYKSERSDLEIRPEIEKRLRWDVLVDHKLIDVQVDNGDVTLRGTVGSAAEKSRARLDAWVGGVESVDDSRLVVARWARDEDLRGTKYVVKSDDELRRAVEDALLFDPRVRSYQITPHVVAGVVTLEGTVDNLKSKQSAAADARNTVGVVRVKNRIKVRPAENLSDDEIEQNIRDNLSRDPYTEPYEIAVVVRHGTAHLYGTVDSYFEKGQAEDVTYRSKGVTGIKNHLEVDFTDRIPHDPYVDPWHIYDYSWYQPAPSRPITIDAEIESDIEDELFWSPYVNSEDISVMVEDGVATLTGTVESWSEYRAAAENAVEGGAIRVINKIQVD